MTTSAEAIYAQVKELSDEDLEETMLAARVLGNVILATEADQHLEQCSQMTQVLPLPYMCLMRGLELGFIMGRSTTDGQAAAERFGDGPLGAGQVDQIFADLRKRKAAIEAARKEQAEGGTATVELPPEKRLILPS